MTVVVFEEWRIGRGRMRCLQDDLGLETQWNFYHEDRFRVTWSG